MARRTTRLRTALTVCVWACLARGVVPAPTLRIGPPVQLSADLAELSHVEPHLAVDPTDADRLLVAAMVGRPEGIAVASYASDDGGLTWSSQSLPDCSYDPWVEFSPDGEGYVSCLAGDDALVFTTSDAGRSWTEPLRIEGGADGELDHCSLAFAQDGSRLVLVGLQEATLDGREYVAPFVSPVPLDDSVTPFRTRLIWNDLWANTLNAAWVGSTLVVAYADFMIPGRGHPSTLRFWSARSSDGGRSFVPPSLLAEVHESSTLPVLARGGPGAAVYVAFDDVRDGRSGVWLVRSVDAGERWSEAVAIATREGGVKRHFNAQVAADAEGGVVVVWYESSEEQDRCFRVLVAASNDGGNSFSPARALRDDTFCVDGEDNGGFAERWPYGGDYFGLAARSVGRFYAVWSDSSTGVFQLWGAPIELGPPE